MLNQGYLAQTLRQPLPTKDGGTLRTVADAVKYIVALPEDRRRADWDRTAQLLLDLADAAELADNWSSPCSTIGSSISKRRRAETPTLAAEPPRRLPFINSIDTPR